VTTECDKGDIVRISAEFRDDNDALIDPGEVFFDFVDPSGNTTSYEHGQNSELVKDGTGQYHVDIDVNESGAWSYRYHSTGTGQASEEGWFWAKRSRF
jgi:hypothetical protein